MHLLRAHYVLLVFSLLILFIHLKNNPELTQHLYPEELYQFNLSISFESGTDVDIYTYLPSFTDRQEIIDESINAHNMTVEYPSTMGGRYIKWSGGEGSQEIFYNALISLKSRQYELSPEIDIPSSYPPEFKDYLAETAAIPVQHNEIKQLWERIKPIKKGNALSTLEAIYNYTYQEIEGLPFKGFTDSLTALRLKAASCNGKSRLFVSLARLNNIPARLVGGIILTKNRKKTSHQWVEVYVENQWVPFDTTNNYFARLPSHYLSLYQGDQQLFRHTTDINFDYSFYANPERVSAALYRETDSANEVIPNAGGLLAELGLPLKTTYIFLMFPLCTLLITFLRNVVGVKTFGVFMPMLIAAASVYTGFGLGLMVFFLVLLLAFLGHFLLGKLHILKVPRLAAIITITTIVFLVGISKVDVLQGFEFGLLALFPVVIISFAADRIHQMASEDNWSEIFFNSLGTVFTTALCFFIFESFLLQGLFSLYPELLLTVLSLQLFIGSWSGMRLSEMIRFRRIMADYNPKVLTINGRNRDFVYKHNEQKLLKLATDKLKTKESLEDKNVHCPRTLAVCDSFSGIEGFLKTLDIQSRCVIKPNKGARGNGIILISHKEDDGYIATSGKFWSKKALRKHIEEILSGSFSQNGDEDSAYIEPMIIQNTVLQEISPGGLCDIRIIVCNGELLSAMLRVPTLRSDGKANLHKGAAGVQVDIETGVTGEGFINGVSTSFHPDSKAVFQGIELPYWQQIKDISIECFVAIPLGYMGVDICIDETLGPIVLEVNGRPGLEIQNIQEGGIHDAVHGAFRSV